MGTEITYLFFFVVLMSLLTRIVGNRRATLRSSNGELIGLYGSNVIPAQEDDVEPAQVPPRLNDVPLQVVSEKR